MERQAVFNVALGCIREVLPDLEDAVISGDDDFENLGANSADRADIIALLLESLNLEIPRITAYGPKTIDGLVDLLHEKLSTT